MSTTPHLALQLLAAAQAQKHVTHNDALASLDALVHLSVKERGRNNPPITPEEGDRYLVGSAGLGDFAAHAGEIALFDLGIWRFFTPRAGWRLHVEAEEIMVMFTGSVWREVLVDGKPFARIGIGTNADDANPLSAKLNAALFTAKAAAEGGSGDLRFALNKEGADRVVSQLYQTGYSARAETGLVGDDDFGIRVSPDGSQWRDALKVDRATGFVTFPNGHERAPNANLLLNALFLVNQRAYAGGTLPADTYGFDRWKAGPGSAVVKRLADGTISLAGTIDQIVDIGQAGALFGARTFAGCTLTFSVEALSAPMQVTIGPHVVSVPGGAGRCAVTVALDDSMTGHVLLRLQTSGTTTFVRPKLELGDRATPYAGEWPETDEIRCLRYYQRMATCGASPWVLACPGQRKSTNQIDFPYVYPVLMRAPPVLHAAPMIWTNGTPGIYQCSFYDGQNNAWITSSSSTISIAASVPASASSVIVRIQAATSFSGAPGLFGQLYFGNFSHLSLNAEL